jgi:hypothetical protein
MAGARKPGPIGTSGEPQDLDDGTMCRALSPRPGPIRMDRDSTRGSHLPPSLTQQLLLSPVFQKTVQITSNMTAPMAWDSYWRMTYDYVDKALQAQANELLKRGNITKLEFDELVNARNTLVQEFRKPLSPFGKQYSEILKPTSKLPQPGELLAKKGSVEAVLASVGKSRATVNRLSMVFRVAGPALLALDITITTIVVMKAAPEQRGRVAARECTGLGFGVAGGAGGAWAGCITLAALGSPTLALPVDLGFGSDLHIHDLVVRGNHLVAHLHRCLEVNIRLLHRDHHVRQADLVVAHGKRLAQLLGLVLAVADLVERGFQRIREVDLGRRRLAHARRRGRFPGRPGGRRLQLRHHRFDAAAVDCSYIHSWLLLCRPAREYNVQTSGLRLSQ